jgi:hypothetical protein
MFVKLMTVISFTYKYGLSACFGTFFIAVETAGCEDQAISNLNFGIAGDNRPAYIRHPLCGMIGNQNSIG